MEPTRVTFLIDCLLENKISDAERNELMEYMDQNRNNTDVTNAFAVLMQRENGVAEIDNARWDKRINELVNVDKTGKVVFWKRGWLRYAAAAIVVFAVGMYLLRSTGSNTAKKQIAVSADKPAPSSMHATLTLANGEKIIIDSASAGMLAVQSDIGIELNANGEIIYNGKQSGVNNSEVQYNTFSVPRGSRIAHLLLSDGTKVFLNAGSSLKYPVVFAKTERRVEITGEAFFEVSKDADRKFMVSDGKSMIEVLGTEFNINSYPDEINTNTTLISGAVRISNIQESVLLNPGQQCVDNKQGELEINNNINLDEVTAWKDGFFYFEEASLKTIARQASRWYNVDFVFENKNAETETFHGKFSRNSSLAELLKVLEYSDVKFKIQGNEVIIR